MATEASQEIPPLAAPLTFSETMNCYFAAENALYEERWKKDHETLTVRWLNCYSLSQMPFGTS